MAFDSIPVGDSDLDGSAPDSSAAALLVIDVVSDYDFPGGDRLLANARRIVEPLAALMERARNARVPVVFVNDNRGRWRDDFRALVRHATRADSAGRDVVERLAPEPEDYFVLKPRHSAFFGTPADVLLRHLGARTLVLAGVEGRSCVLATAMDAHVREYDVVIARDCVASADADENAQALALAESAARARVAESAHIDLAALAAGDERYR